MEGGAPAPSSFPYRDDSRGDQVSTAPAADSGMVAPASVEPLLREHAALEQQLADPSLHYDQNRARQIGRRYAELSQVVEAYRSYESASNDLDAARELAVEDPTFAAEAESLVAKRDELGARLTL